MRKLYNAYSTRVLSVDSAAVETRCAGARRVVVTVATGGGTARPRFRLFSLIAASAGLPIYTHSELRE